MKKLTTSKEATQTRTASSPHVEKEIPAAITINLDEEAADHESTDVSSIESTPLMSTIEIVKDFKKKRAGWSKDQPKRKIPLVSLKHTWKTHRVLNGSQLADYVDIIVEDSYVTATTDLLEQQRRKIKAEYCLE